MSQGGTRRIDVDGGIRWLLLRAFRVFWILWENAAGLAIYITAMVVCRPLNWIAPRLYWKVDEHFVWLGMNFVSYWMTAAVGKVQVYGDDLEPYMNEPCLLLVNHQSDADPLIFLVSCRSSPLKGKISVVLEDIFHWTHFGIMMRARGDFFIHQGREQRHMQSALMEEHIRKYERLRDPRWCLLFPEGGFLKKRKQRNMEYAKKNGYPVLENVLLPRLGAAQALLNAVPNEDSKHASTQNGHAFHHDPKRYFRHIIDVTIAYPEGKPLTLLDMLFAFSPIPHAAIHFRVRNVDESGKFDEERLRKFLYGIWTEKDQLLQSYYETGAFPDHRYDDNLGIDYPGYARSYAIAMPLLIFYTFCAWKCLSYTCWCLLWFVRLVY